MAGSVVVEQVSVAVVPGGTGTSTVRIRNTGTVVDQFSLTVLGQPAAWTTVVPAALSLFPGADGVIELHFAPPRAPGVGAGPTPFGVRVVGSEDPDNPVVEEGEVDLQPFVDVTAKITPRTSESKRKARHEVVLDNKGNTAVHVALQASDPDEQLAFELKDPSVTVEAGQSRHVPLKVAAKKGFARGADKHRPFQVTARPDGSAMPLVLDANLVQKAGLPRFLVPLVAGVVALALIAAVVPGMLGKDGGGGIIDLANSDSPTTTVATAEEEEAGDDPNAAATPEEAAAAAAAELAANGQDGSSATGGGTASGGVDTGTSGGGTSASGAGGGSTGGGSNSGDESTSVTSPSATTAPPAGSPSTTAAGGTTATTAGGTTATTTTSNSTTTTTAATTTTPSQMRGKFAGAWATADSGSKMSISVGSSMSVSAAGAVGSFNCIGSVTDADDGSFTAGKCSDGGTRTITYLSSTDQVRVTAGTDCGFSRCPSFTFNRN